MGGREECSRSASPKGSMRCENASVFAVDGRPNSARTRRCHTDIPYSAQRRAGCSGGISNTPHDDVVPSASTKLTTKGGAGHRKYKVIRRVLRHLVLRQLTFVLCDQLALLLFAR